MKLDPKKIIRWKTFSGCGVLKEYVFWTATGIWTALARTKIEALEKAKKV